MQILEDSIIIPWNILLVKFQCHLSIFARRFSSFIMEFSPFPNLINGKGILYIIKSSKKSISFSKSNGYFQFLSLFLTRIKELSSGLIIFWNNLV
jgi:hypothetical protein